MTVQDAKARKRQRPPGDLSAARILRLAALSPKRNTHCRPSRAMIRHACRRPHIGDQPRRCWCCWRCSARRNCSTRHRPVDQVDLVPSDQYPAPAETRERRRPPAWDLPGEQSGRRSPRRAAQTQAAPAQPAPDNSRQALLKPQAADPRKVRLRHPRHPSPTPSIFDPAASRCCSTCRTCRAEGFRRRIDHGRQPVGRRARGLQGATCASAGSCRAPRRSTRRRAWCCGSICAATRRLRAIRS